MDTIAALATPPGRSALGVIRLSGPGSLTIARFLIDEVQFAPEPGRVFLRSIKAPSRPEILDRSLLTYFEAPNSYTGENVVEISCHGSPVILRQILDLILGAGGRLAAPGEFTMRALRNGKLNLTQAEAIRDLIDAQTDAAARQAVRQLKGELSARLRTSKETLVQVIVLLESAIEFVEDDLPDLRGQHVISLLAEVIANLDKLASTFRVGHLLREGLKVTIVGRPNVGKSSLFNRLLVSDRAIVTAEPGTTRDTLTEPISLDGMPVLLTDTAGVRESNDTIESMGVERARQAMADADLLLVVIDRSVGLCAEDFEVLSQARHVRHVIARNKSDRPPFGCKRNGRSSHFGTRAIDVSAVTGFGLDELRTAILEPFGLMDQAESGFIVTNARHYDLLRRAGLAIQSSVELLDENASEELVVLGLHSALRLLGEITGETTTEDILSEIFATFCIGK